MLDNVSFMILEKALIKDQGVTERPPQKNITTTQSPPPPHSHRTRKVHMAQQEGVKLEVGHSATLDDRFAVVTMDVSAAKPQPLTFIVVTDTSLNLSDLEKDLAPLKERGAVTIFDIHESKRKHYTEPGYLGLPELLNSLAEEVTENLKVIIYITDSAVSSSEWHLHKRAAENNKNSAALFTIGMEQGYDSRPLRDLVKAVGNCGFHQHATSGTLRTALNNILIAAQHIRSVKLVLELSCLNGGRIGQILRYWPDVAEVGHNGRIDLWKVLPTPDGKIKLFLDLPRRQPEKLYINGQSSLGQKWNFVVPFDSLSAASAEDVKLYEELLTAWGVVTECPFMASEMAKQLGMTKLASQISEADKNKADQLEMIERMRFYFLDRHPKNQEEKASVSPMVT